MKALNHKWNVKLILSNRFAFWNVKGRFCLNICSTAGNQNGFLHLHSRLDCFSFFIAVKQARRRIGFLRFQHKVQLWSKRFARWLQIEDTWDHKDLLLHLSQMTWMVYTRVFWMQLKSSCKDPIQPNLRTQTFWKAATIKIQFFKQPNLIQGHNSFIKAIAASLFQQLTNEHLNKAYASRRRSNAPLIQHQQNSTKRGIPIKRYKHTE